MLETIHETLVDLLDLLEPLILAVLLIPVELLVQWLQAAQRAAATFGWSALT